MSDRTDYSVKGTYLIVNLPTNVAQRKRLITPLGNGITFIHPTTHTHQSPADPLYFGHERAITYHSAYAAAENVFLTRSMEMDGAEKRLSLDRCAVYK